MVNNVFRATAMVAGAVLLVACGGGGGGGDGLADPPDTPMPLSTRAEGLRALGFSLGGPLSTYAELPIDNGEAKAKNSGGFIWNSGSRAKAIVEDCDSGSYRYEDGTKPRDFDQLSPAAKGVSVYFEKGSNNNCQYSYEEDGIRYVSLDSGTAENGQSDVLQSGQYEYFVFGTGSTPLLELYQELYGNQLVYEERIESNGTLERLLGQSEIRYGLRYDYRFSVLEDGERISVAWGLGQGNTPVRARVGLDGSWFTLAGSVAIGAGVEGCRGGRLVLSTPSAGGVSVENGRAVGGQLKIQAGTNTALYTFSNDGGTTMIINGGPAISVTAEEVRNAVLDPNFCEY